MKVEVTGVCKCPRRYERLGGEVAAKKKELRQLGNERSKAKQKRVDMESKVREMRLQNRQGQRASSVAIKGQPKNAENVNRKSNEVKLALLASG